MAHISLELLSELQRYPQNIRHICILAHVDHGKTTLADSILASNGIIPQKMIGTMRYMDSRKDEQERGITMKSSSMAVHYKYDEKHYLVNVIDSPGHADFTGEVSTAVRLCDGAIILVDVLEGVCSQTKVALKQAWIERLRPLLVLNKIDRLILEWKMSPSDAFAHLSQILEKVNAVVGELFATDIIKKSDETAQTKGTQEQSSEVFDWTSGLDESDDSSVYFSPQQGNVIFASALDGWGFHISSFAKIYSTKLGFKEEVLNKVLWGDFYLNAKTKRIMKGAQAKGKKPLFVQLIAENLWSVYNAIMVTHDSSVIEKIVSSLDLKISSRDAKQSFTRHYLQVVFSQWLPLSSAILEMVCRFVPSPLNLDDEKVDGLMCSNMHKFDCLPPPTQLLKKDFKACSSMDNVPIIVCISKMFPVKKESLTKNKLRIRSSKASCLTMTDEEIALRRKMTRKLIDDRMETGKLSQESVKNEDTDIEKSSLLESSSDTAFIAFARVYSGKIKKGQKVYVLGPKHDPSKALKHSQSYDETLTLKDLSPEQHITVATIGEVYLLMGEDVIEIQEGLSGNVVGIGGLEDHILKSATLSSTVACTRFVDLHSTTTPIMRVALEPSHSTEMPQLVQGMKLLNQADPCVQVLIQESGEHVLVAAGEVHLQRCVNDLKERFAKIEINVSAPIVPFRETIILPPKVDMVKEAIEEKQAPKTNLLNDNEDGIIRSKTSNKLSSICIQARPLPPTVTKLLEQNTDLLKLLNTSQYSVSNGEYKSGLTTDVVRQLDAFKMELSNLFDKEGEDWSNAMNEIWSFGPRRCGSNILLNRVEGYSRRPVWQSSQGDKNTSVLSNYDSSFVNGFQLATLSGPLCDEPMTGVCFVVEEWTIAKDLADSELNLPDNTTLKFKEDQDLCDVAEDSHLVNEMNSAVSTPYGSFSGQIMSTVKEACWKAFQAQPQRLVAAMYSCNIQVTADMLGKVYGVLRRRQGRVLHADTQEGSQTFFVNAELPVVESFDFANEIRKQTSGVALPQLVFSHWEVVDCDPFWVPNTEEEYAHFGEKADSENRARKYMNSVRKRKGLNVDEKIVEHAEKQRTLAKKK